MIKEEALSEQKETTFIEEKMKRMEDEVKKQF